MFLVVVTNTIVYPRAVMVHPCYAAPTNRAMVRRRWFNAIALFTLFVDQIIQEFDTTSVVSC